MKNGIKYKLEVVNKTPTHTQWKDSMGYKKAMSFIPRSDRNMLAGLSLAAKSLRKFSTTKTIVLTHKSGEAFSLKLKTGESVISGLRVALGSLKCVIASTRNSNKLVAVVVTLPGNVKAEKYDEVYIKPGYFLLAQNRKRRTHIFNAKKPLTNDKHIGIEIELASTLDRELLADKLFDAGLAAYVCIKSDSSIGAGGGALRDYAYAHEIAVCVKESEMERIVDKLCTTLESCEVKVDKTCGLHVHLDMRNEEESTLSRVFGNLMSMQHFLYAMSPATRRVGSYCKTVGNRKWHVMSDRYRGINTNAYQKYRTIEMRMHSGTVDSSKIRNWINLLLAIKNAPEIKRAPTTMKGVVKQINISDDLASYITSRIRKFAKGHAELDHDDNLVAIAQMTPPTITEEVVVEEASEITAA